MNIDNFLALHNSAKYITSKSNSLVVDSSKLQSDKYRKQSKTFLAEGKKLVKEALKYTDVSYILISENVLDDSDILSISDECLMKNVQLVILSEDAFSKVSTEQSPQGVIAVVNYLSEIHVNNNLEKWAEKDRLILLDEIRDPGNLGTLIRSAEAFGIDGIILHSCADCYNPKVVRAAMGALYRMPLYITNTTDEFDNVFTGRGRRLIGATLGENSLTLGKYEPHLTDCIVIGNEGHGISDAVLKCCSNTVKIPMAGLVESLNASAAGVCIMWEYYRKFGNI